MKLTLLNKLAQLTERLDEIDRLLAVETVTSNMDNYRKLTREHAEISPVVALYRAYTQTEVDIAGATEMLGDAEMKELAEQEIAEGKGRLLELETRLQTELLPKDPNDERNIFLEIRAGTGGDESALISADLFRMYTRYAERQRWKVEIISESMSELGGYKEVIIKIIGRGAFSR